MVLLILPNSTYLFGQVVIKEKIEINPSITTHGKTSMTASQTHTIKAQVPWGDGSKYMEYYRAKMQIKNICTGDIVESGFESAGYSEVSMTTTNGGTYKITAVFEGWNSWGENWVPTSVNHIFEVYIDGQ